MVREDDLRPEEVELPNDIVFELKNRTLDSDADLFTIRDENKLIIGILVKPGFFSLLQYAVKLIRDPEKLNELDQANAVAETVSKDLIDFEDLFNGHAGDGEMGAV